MYRKFMGRFLLLFIAFIISNNVINAAVGDTFSSNFTDQNLATDVARNLSKSSTDTISLNDVNQLTYYSLNTNKSVKDLSGIETFNKLTILNVIYNPIEIIPENISQLTNLETLRISYGQLSSLPSGIGSLSNLRGLQLDNNHLTSLPNTISNLTNIQDVYLSDNPLDSLPEFNLSYPNLKYFTLANTNVTRLPDTIGNLTNITYFILSHNKLEVLPESFTRLTKLETLDIDHNFLGSLPNSLGNMTKLKYINAFENALTSLPDSLKDLAELESLQLSNNKLTKIPTSINSLDKLSYVDLSNNNLSEFPLELNQAKMTALDISNNNLTSVPAFINGLTKLDYLVMNNNKISELPSFLSTDSIPNLYQVDVVSNQLKSIPVLKIPSLNVSNNILVDAIPDNFDGVVNTEHQLVDVPDCNYTLDSANPFDIDDILVGIIKQYKGLNGDIFDSRVTWKVTTPDQEELVFRGGEEAQLNAIVNKVGTYKISFNVLFMPSRVILKSNLQGSTYNFTVNVKDSAIEQTILEGVVYDKKTNKVIKDTLIKIENNNSTITTIKTDAQGKYKVLDLNAQKYNIVASKNKYKTKTDSINIVANTTNTKDFYLELESVKPPIEDNTKKPLPESGAINVIYLLISTIVLASAYPLIKKYKS